MSIFLGDATTEVDPEAIRLVESILKQTPIMRHKLHHPFRMALKLRQPFLADTSLTEFMDRDHSSSFMETSASTFSVCLGH